VRRAALALALALAACGGTSHTATTSTAPTSTATTTTAPTTATAATKTAPTATAATKTARTTATAPTRSATTTATAPTATAPTTTAPTTATAAPGLSHAELIARLDAICAAGNAKFVAAAHAGTAARLETGLRVSVETQSQVQALQPSAQDRAALDAYRQALARQFELYRRLVSAARSNAGKATLLRIGLAFSGASQERASAAARLGAQKCVRS
jgi:hypothetical protein